MARLVLTPAQKEAVEMLCAAFYGSTDEKSFAKTKMFMEAAKSLGDLVDQLYKRDMLHGPDGIATQVKKELTAQNIVNPKYAKR